MIYLLFLILILLALVLIGVGITLQDVQDLKRRRSDARPTILIGFSYADRRTGARRTTSRSIKMGFMPTEGDFINLPEKYADKLGVPNGGYIVTSCHHRPDEGGYSVLAERQELGL